MNFIKTILAYPLTAIYYIFFALTLLIFHPIQWVAFNLFGYQAHKKSVDYLNLCLTSCLYLLGTTVKFNFKEDLPTDVPIIFVSNHQGLNDIPPIYWFLRKYHPKFVSKIELGKGIPSVSYNLRHGGSVLINRKDPKQAIPALKEFGTYLEKNKRSAVIFPEGTRSRNGVPKTFSVNGLKMMVKFCPSSYVVPITINNSWKLEQNGRFPMVSGVRLMYDIHEPIKADSLPFDELFAITEKTIKDSIMVTS